MKIVEELYPDDSVKIRVSKVYREVVLFARESFKYFADKTWRECFRRGKDQGLNIPRQDRKCSSVSSRNKSG